MSWFSHLSTWQQGLLTAYAGIVLATYVRYLLLSFELRHTPFLGRNSPPFDAEEVPLVSILVPAKDEAGRIEHCLSSLCAQDYPNLEILVVDDRSTDDTAKIVSRWADRDPRIKLLRVFELAPGWTGKAHALHVGQGHARGEWLFFVDADTRLHPSCLSIALRDAVDSGAEMESLMPALVSESFWVNVVQPRAVALLLVLHRPNRVNGHTSRESGFAVGAFILIRQDAYNAIGGYEGMRGKLDDLHLARNARTHGVRLRIIPAPELAVVGMYSTMKEFIPGWTRIFYGMVEPAVDRLWQLLALLCVLSALPYAVLAAGGLALLAGLSSPFVVAGFALGLAHEACQMAFNAVLFARMRTGLRFLPFRMASVFVMIHVLLRAIRMCGTHEVTWRGTTYTAAFRRAPEELVAVSETQSVPQGL